MFSNEKAKKDTISALNKAKKSLYNAIQNLTFDIDLRTLKFQKDKDLVKNSQQKLRDVHSKIIIFLNRIK